MLTIFIPIVILSPAASSSKKGLANAWADNWRDAKTVGATWAYYWSPYVLNTPGIESLPMIRDESQMNIPAKGNFCCLLGFNEPDLYDQGKVAPERAAELWRIIEARYPAKFLVSPAPSHLHPEWLERFRTAYIARYGQAPKLDALAAHCYLTEPECEEYVSNVIKLADEWGINGGVWVTEFAFWNTDDLGKFVIWLEANPRVARYAVYTNRIWYMEWPTALFTTDGRLTEYGEMYRRIQ